MVFHRTERSDQLRENQSTQAGSDGQTDNGTGERQHEALNERGSLAGSVAWRSPGCAAWSAAEAAAALWPSLSRAMIASQDTLELPRSFDGDNSGYAVSGAARV